MALPQLPPELERMFAAGGAMGAFMRSVDWSATPIGAPVEWPQSLRTAVSVCLESRFPLLIWWGPDLVKIYNDAYRSVIGSKHPKAMGQRGRDCWPEIWDTIGPMLERVLEGRGATYSEDQLLPLVRHGFPEECYFTFSYSPIRDESGGVGGVFTAVTETTGRVIGARRLATLRSLAQRMVGAASPEQVVEEAASVLETARPDVPCAVLYRVVDEGVQQMATSGGLGESELSAVEKAVGSVLPDPGSGGTVVRLDLPVGADVHELMVLPVEASGFTARLVAGISPMLLLDDDYRAFLVLVAGQVSVALSEALGFQAERSRAEALAALDQAKTAFFANISHEFRTPLTLMLGPTEDALVDTDEPLGTRQRARAELVRRNALRLLKLVNTLLDFSRLESGRIHASFEPVEVGRYTADVASVFRAAIEQAGLAFYVDCPPISQPVFVDREMWENIVLNLLSNALKFTFDGSITIRLREDGESVTLSVEDTGVGIEPKDRPALFDRFHRVQGTRSRTFEGSGIGLALVAELAALHGGSVGVSSTPGEGSSFIVTIPFGWGHLPADQVRQRGAGSEGDRADSAGFVTEALRWLEEDREAPPVAPTESAQPRPRVLVVDDNADMRDYLTAVLGTEYTVQGVSDGAAALELIRAHLPDLVLADVMMPRLDGFGLLSALRADPLTAHLPVIMLSARAGAEAAVEGLEAGADDYLTKPFAAREVRARVRTALTLESMRREQGRDRQMLAQLETSRAKLDMAQRLARVGSWELDLDSGALTASEELLRQLQLSEDVLADGGFNAVLEQRVHPDDVQRVRNAVSAAVEGAPMDHELRIITPDGNVRTYRTIGVLERDSGGRPVRLLGSNQDITEQRQVELARAAELAAREAAAREHRIADTLQHSLLPTDTYLPKQLQIASYYRAGTEGTQVGGDWYDVIELGADRTALVIGDVMGRGVRAAAVMGQLRAAIRAYSRLELPPGHLLELLDGVVRDFADDQIVTCVYAVYDPADRTLTYANAGHLPPLLVTAGETRPLDRSLAPPLGTGWAHPEEGRALLNPGATLALYTDGLVERRDRDIDSGLRTLGRTLAHSIAEPLVALPEKVTASLDLTTHHDDVALLLVRIAASGNDDDVASCDISTDADVVSEARSFALQTLHPWHLAPQLADDIVLAVSELVTNAIVHGRPPISLQLRRTSEAVVVQVCDGAAFLPRRLRPAPEDERGRGIQLVALLADRWGARPTPNGKATWCVFRLDRPAATASTPPATPRPPASGW